MSTYYFLVCDRHEEYTDAASRTAGGGICHLANSTDTLLPFLVSHCGCNLRVISEYHKDREKIMTEYTEWTEDNIYKWWHNDIPIVEFGHYECDGVYSLHPAVLKHKAEKTDEQ